MSNSISYGQEVSRMTTTELYERRVNLTEWQEKLQKRLQGITTRIKEVDAELDQRLEFQEGGVSNRVR